MELVAKSDHLSLILGTGCWKDRSDPHKVSWDLHTCVLAYKNTHSK